MSVTFTPIPFSPLVIHHVLSIPSPALPSPSFSDLNRTSPHPSPPKCFLFNLPSTLPPAPSLIPFILQSVTFSFSQPYLQSFLSSLQSSSSSSSSSPPPPPPASLRGDCIWEISWMSDTKCSSISLCLLLLRNRQNER